MSGNFGTVAEIAMTSAIDISDATTTNAVDTIMNDLEQSITENIRTVQLPTSLENEPFNVTCAVDVNVGSGKGQDLLNTVINKMENIIFDTFTSNFNVTREKIFLGVRPRSTSTEKSIYFSALTAPEGVTTK